MNDLVVVKGLNESFCDITIITKVIREHVVMAVFPEHFVSLKDANQSIEFRKKISLLSIKQDNFYNSFRKNYFEYHKQEKESWCFWGWNQEKIHAKSLEHFKKDFENMLDILPKKFYTIKEFKIDATSEIDYINIKAQAISYLQQKHPSAFKLMIGLLKDMNAQHNNQTDFNKYIDNWAKRLLKQF